jgi:two-component system KDP operon response regulator KdpE
MIRYALTFAQFDVTEAGNGLHALRQIDAHPPDAIILDLGLPIVSGQTVLAEIAAHAHTKHIPVVVITGTAGNHRGLGAVCVVRKPFDVDELIKTVRDCVPSAGGGA